MCSALNLRGVGFEGEKEVAEAAVSARVASCRGAHGRVQGCTDAIAGMFQCGDQGVVLAHGKVAESADGHVGVGANSQVRTVHVSVCTARGRGIREVHHIGTVVVGEVGGGAGPMA